MTNNVKIKLIDGEEMVVSDVEQYGLTPDNAAYFVARFGYKIFFNPSQVKYIGREFDIDNKPRRWN